MERLLKRARAIPDARICGVAHPRPISMPHAQSVLAYSPKLDSSENTGHFQVGIEGGMTTLRGDFFEM